MADWGEIVGSGINAWLAYQAGRNTSQEEWLDPQVRQEMKLEVIGMIKDLDVADSQRSQQAIESWTAFHTKVLEARIAVIRAKAAIGAASVTAQGQGLAVVDDISNAMLEWEKAAGSVNALNNEMPNQTAYLNSIQNMSASRSDGYENAMGESPSLDSVRIALDDDIRQLSGMAVTSYNDSDKTSIDKVRTLNGGVEAITTQLMSDLRVAGQGSVPEGAEDHIRQQAFTVLAQRLGVKNEDMEAHRMAAAQARGTYDDISELLKKAARDALNMGVSTQDIDDLLTAMTDTDSVLSMTPSELMEAAVSEPEPGSQRALTRQTLNDMLVQIDQPIRRDPLRQAFQRYQQAAQERTPDGHNRLNDIAGALDLRSEAQVVQYFNQTGSFSRARLAYDEGVAYRIPRGRPLQEHIRLVLSEEGDPRALGLLKRYQPEDYERLGTPDEDLLDQTPVPDTGPEDRRSTAFLDLHRTQEMDTPIELPSDGALPPRLQEEVDAATAPGRLGPRDPIMPSFIYEPDGDLNAPHEELQRRTDEARTLGPQPGVLGGPEDERAAPQAPAQPEDPEDDLYAQSTMALRRIQEARVASAPRYRQERGQIAKRLSDWASQKVGPPGETA